MERPSWTIVVLKEIIFFKNIFQKNFGKIFFEKIFLKKYFCSLCRCGFMLVILSSLDYNRKFHSRIKIHGFWGNKISIIRSTTWKVWNFKVQFFLFLNSFFLMCYNSKAYGGMFFFHTATKIAKTDKFWGGKMENCHFTPQVAFSTHDSGWKLYPNVFLSCLKL